MNSKDARAKVDKLEGEMRDLRALDNQRWEVQDVAQRNLHTSIHKITLDQQQFQVRRKGSRALPLSGCCSCCT